jgi:Spy/CpxP family protein refolding chaperone
MEKRNRRLTVALTMMAVTMCAVVTMAATGEK